MCFGNISRFLRLSFQLLASGAPWADWRGSKGGRTPAEDVCRNILSCHCAMFGERSGKCLFLGFIFFVAYFCLLLKPKNITDGVEQPLLILINDAHNATTLGMSQRPCHVQNIYIKELKSVFQENCKERELFHLPFECAMN